MNWRTIPSSTNFVFTQPCDANGVIGEKTALSLFEFLCQRKILVRYFPDHPLFTLLQIKKCIPLVFLKKVTILVHLQNIWRELSALDIMMVLLQ